MALLHGRTSANRLLTYEVSTPDDGTADSIYDLCTADQKAVLDSVTVLEVRIFAEGAVDMRGTTTNGNEYVDIAASEWVSLPVLDAVKGIEFRTDGATAAATTINVMIFVD